MMRIRVLISTILATLLTPCLSWTQGLYEPVQTLSPPQLLPDSRFGDALAAQADVFLVGAPGYEAASNGGGVFVYGRTGDDLNLIDHWTGPSANVQFGDAVALDGDVAVVGAPNVISTGLGAGAVYVYRRQGDGTWSLEQEILPPEGLTYAAFGLSVSVSGNRFAVGAPLADFVGSDSGVVYTFSFDGSQWVFENRIEPANIASKLFFGWDIDLEGDRLAIGAPTEALQGHGYIFERSQNGWDPVLQTNGLQSYRLGYSVSLEGDLVVFGMPRYDQAIGALRVLEFQGTQWQRIETIQGSDVQSYRLGLDSVIHGGEILGLHCAECTESVFVQWRRTDDGFRPHQHVGSETGGSRLAATSNLVMMGSPNALSSGRVNVLKRETTPCQERTNDRLIRRDFQQAPGSFGRRVVKSGEFLFASDIPSPSDEGQVIVYRDQGSRWEEFQILTSTDLGFGSDISVDGDWLAISNRSQNEVFFYEFDGSTWVERQRIEPSNGVAGDWFGDSVSLDANTLVVGSPFHRGTADYSGIVYVYRRVGSQWTEEAQLLGSQTGAGDYLGQKVVVQGDVAVVAAPRADWMGEAYVFRRVGASWIEEARLIPSNRDSWESFGSSLAMDGNIIVCGAPGDGAGNEGTASVFSNIAGSWVEEVELMAPVPQFQGNFGASLAVSGQTIYVSEIGSDHTFPGSGRVLVFEKRADVWENVSVIYPSESQPRLRFGAHLDLDKATGWLAIGDRYEGIGLRRFGLLYLTDTFFIRFGLAPQVVEPLDSVELTGCGGEPQSLLLLYVSSLEGQAFFSPLIQTLWDERGEWGTSLSIPAGIGPLSIELTLAGVNARCDVQLSDPTALRMQ